MSRKFTIITDQKMITMKDENQPYPFIEYNGRTFNEVEMLERSKEFYLWMNQRRSVREISTKKVPKEVIQNILLSAGTAPSGANMQPWTFVAVENPTIKAKIREAAEKEEFQSYNSRMPEEWLNDLKPLGTDWTKPFLETAPWLIVAFRKSYRLIEGKKLNNYYVTESIGLACGMLLNAIHHAGLVSLTHTPSPMNFLTEILRRPENEKPFLLIPVGYPAEGALVPDIHRKSLEDIAVFV